MRQTLSRGMVAAAAATGILSLCGNPVYADSAADGATTGSPGIASGNTLQIPVDIPINVCGNSVDVVGILNPAFGNFCANRPHTPGSVPIAPAAGIPPHGPTETPCFCGHGGTVDDDDFHTSPHVPEGGHGPGQGHTVDHGDFHTSPHVPVGGHNRHHTDHVTPHGTTHQPPLVPVTTHIGSKPVMSSHKPATLAETGSEEMLAASAISVALMAGGLILYRRARGASRW
ncbi:chaplin family protein [Streptomyces sp. NPDC001020]